MNFSSGGPDGTMPPCLGAIESGPCRPLPAGGTGLGRERQPRLRDFGCRRVHITARMKLVAPLESPANPVFYPRLTSQLLAQALLPRPNDSTGHNRCRWRACRQPPPLEIHWANMPTQSLRRQHWAEPRRAFPPSFRPQVQLKCNYFVAHPGHPGYPGEEKSWT